MFSLRTRSVREKVDSIIDSSLKNRGSLKDDYVTDKTYDIPNYVVRMCEKIRSVVGTKVPMKEILKADMHASGHADYQRKFSLYCSELEQRY